MIASGEPLTAEARLDAGQPVAASARRAVGAGRRGDSPGQRNSLLVAVNFLQRGASVLVDDCQLERLV